MFEEEISKLSKSPTPREELELLRDIRNKASERIKELTTTSEGVLYNTLFRECLEDIVATYTRNDKCERYREYEKLRTKIVKDLPYDTHAVLREEYFELLERIESLGYSVSQLYKEV